VIAVDRGAEPAALQEARARRLPVVRAEWQANGASAALKAGLTGYGVAKKTLYDRQHGKCAYCERSPGFGGQPVEHFRPKKEAWLNRPGAPRVVDRQRYWWLTWTWGNLLFACHTCNNPSLKGNRFPLAASTEPLPIESEDTALESPLLLDPSEAGFDIRQHLRWRPVERTAARPIWRWQLATLTDRGEVTAGVLGLRYLTDDLNAHYRGAVWPRFEAEVSHKVAAGASPRALFGSWGSLCRSLITIRAPWTAATWFMLDALRVGSARLEAAALPAPRWPS